MLAKYPLQRFSAVVLGIGVILGLSRMAAAQPSDSTMILEPLQPQLSERAASSRERAPKETMDLYDGAINDLRESGILERALSVGDTAADFALPSATGDTVRLSALLDEGPVVITWYRGGWCPYCNMTLAAWRKAAPMVAAQGAQLVAISPEVPDSSLSTKQKNELDFHVLSDPGNTVARTYNIAYQLPDEIVESYSKFFSLSEYNGDERNELPLSVTYIIDPDRIVRYAFLDADYKKRAEPADVLSALKQLKGM
jgi:peroxiredoxin